MKEHSSADFDAAIVIVKYGAGSKVLKIAKQNGIPNAAVFLGTGTAKSRILEFLELTDIRKEIVLMMAEKQVMEAVLKSIDDEIVFYKPNHGIAFTMPLSALLNFMGCKRKDKSDVKADGVMYKSIITVVERGKAELVMEAATEAGARGGTIIKARGAGAYEAGKLFNMEIEPEKEIVLILAEAAAYEKIAESVYNRLEIGKEGNGIIFCQDVSTVYGIS